MSDPDRTIDLDDFILYLETKVPYFKGRHKGVLTLFKRLLEEYYASLNWSKTRIIFKEDLNMRIVIKEESK